MSRLPVEQNEVRISRSYSEERVPVSSGPLKAYLDPFETLTSYQQSWEQVRVLRTRVHFIHMSGLPLRTVSQVANIMKPWFSVEGTFKFVPEIEFIASEFNRKVLEVQSVN